MYSTRILHISSTRAEDTLNRVLVTVAAGAHVTDPVPKVPKQPEPLEENWGDGPFVDALPNLGLTDSKPPLTVDPGRKGPIKV